MNHARRDLCGGCAAMRIPTAIGTEQPPQCTDGSGGGLEDGAIEGRSGDMEACGDLGNGDLGRSAGNISI